MVPVLSRLSVLLIALAAATAPAAETETRHDVTVEMFLSQIGASTDLREWPAGGAGKLLYADGTDHRGRILARYRGRITNTLWSEAVLDFNSAASTEVGLTEAFLSWRPVPKSARQYRLRLGAFYPPFSLENGDVGWSSPFGTAFSAINAWLAEEIRPVGAELTIRRRLGDPGSGQEIAGFGAAFYGNDPAGTLLFWRGFSVHDRQTRLNERVALPTLTFTDATGAVTRRIERRLDPIAEIDHEPGFYGGVEWRLRRKAIVQVARYDNRADPYAFRDGQWGWDTAFWHVATQITLPAGFGLVAQWMRGETLWLTHTTTAGLTTARTEFVDDNFDSSFVLLTRRLGDRHRLSVRYDRFGFQREGENLNIDEGHASTLSYEFRGADRLRITAEWIRIESERDLWSIFYAAPESATETQLQLTLSFDLKGTR